MSVLTKSSSSFLRLNSFVVMNDHKKPFHLNGRVEEECLFSLDLYRIRSDNQMDEKPRNPSSSEDYDLSTAAVEVLRESV